MTPATSGVGAQIRAARETQGMTWYAVAKRAGIPNPSTIRDIEYGRDTKLSSVEAVAHALGLRLELVEA
ncbi:MAG TPA: helix-turn-helix transcriptional regulator [Pirellulales bacterium]|nr:helix-turn-helix transcriptional regulator [Pirellulales bacterium]